MIRLDKRTAVRLLREKANVQPNRVANCVYMVGEKPECIIGHILLELKPQIKPVLKANESNGLGWAQFRKELKANGISFTRGAAGVLVAAQREQDTGHSWKAAVDFACGMESE